VTTHNTHTVRNLVIFTALVIILGWLGYGLGVMGGTTDSQGLGMLIWLVSPLVACVGLRLFGGDGWQDMGLRLAFKGNGLGYALSVLIYPLATLVILLLGALFGSVTFDFGGDKAAAFVPALLGALVFNFIKNILEEFGWRGYLTPKMAKLGLPDTGAHLIVGLIWALWHLPYYLGLLSAAEMEAYTSLSLGVFLPFTLVGIVAASIAFGEIRLLTGSVWPAVLLHAVSNAVILTVLTGGYAIVSPAAELAFTPGMHGILSIIIIVVVGLWLYRRRTGKAS
jgi:membrane protease YdiL (CAAX protease family)